MKTTSRVLLCLAALIGVAAHADGYPAHPITLIVPFTPGGAVDSVARTYASVLQAKLGQPVVVDNRAGAGGAIGAQAVARAAPDGYTLLLGSVGPMTINPSLSKLPFDVARDFEPVVLLARTPAILVVPPSNPARTIREFNEWVKSKPGTLSFGSAGTGNITHLVCEYYLSQAGLKANHIPYKGSAQAVTDMLGGQLDFMFDVVPTAQPYVKSGQFKAIAVTTITRSKALPDVPTLDELGYKGFDVSSWFGIFAPAGTPADIVEKLNAVANSELRGGSGLEKLHTIGAEFGGGSPAQFKQMVASETSRWKKVIDDAGIKAE